MKYSPGAFIKIKAICREIQEKVDLDDSDIVELIDDIVCHETGIYQEDLEKVLELLEKREGVINLIKKELVEADAPIYCGTLYKIKTLPKFSKFIRDEIKLLPGISKVEKVEKLYFTDSGDFIVNDERVIKLFENRSKNSCKSLKVLDSLWQNRVETKKGNRREFGEALSKENLRIIGGCISLKALDKLVNRLNGKMNSMNVPANIGEPQGANNSLQLSVVF